MRSHLIIALLLLTASCGKKTVNKYIENPYNDSDISDRVSQLEYKVSQLQTQIATNIDTTNHLAEQIYNLSLENVEHSASISTLESAMVLAENQAQQAMGRLAALEAEDRVVEYIDPCGASSGFDEVILKTSTGKLLAYFESGTQRYLTVLKKNQSYRTTDAQSCNFSVNAQGELVW